MSAKSFIEIRSYRGGWQCFEEPGVAPYFIGSNGKEQAINYATQRMKSRTAEIRVVDRYGAVEKVLTFTNTREL